MHKHFIEQNWQQFKHKIHTRWNKLTNEDMEHIKGQYYQLVSKIQNRYGYSKEKAEGEIKSWMEMQHRDELHNWNKNHSSCGSCESHEHPENWKKKRKAG